jgi:hypothetical protein
MRAPGQFACEPGIFVERYDQVGSHSSVRDSEGAVEGLECRCSEATAPRRIEQKPTGRAGEDSGRYTGGPTHESLGGVIRLRGFYDGGGEGDEGGSD